VFVPAARELCRREQQRQADAPERRQEQIVDDVDASRKVVQLPGQEPGKEDGKRKDRKTKAGLPNPMSNSVKFSSLSSASSNHTSGSS
jgi:phosphosulfolactate synthase (CoM biosynthesis protein A)